MRTVYTIVRLTFEFAAALVIGAGVIGGLLHLIQELNRQGMILLGG